MSKALILIDLQNDFLPGGALAVPQGDQIIPLANVLQSYFDLVIATQDWHPANHGSFAVNQPPYQVGDVIEWQGLSQVLWPAHCIQQSQGAALSADLKKTKINKIIVKGTNPDIDSYSAFFDNAHRQKTELDAYLRHRKVTEVYLLGLATDYCVKYSALDAVKLGYQTHVIIDACRGIDLVAGDVAQAIEEMQAVGVEIVMSDRIIIK